MKIEHIKDLLPALEGRKDFVVLNKQDYYAVDYVYVQDDSFDHPLRLECRGIKFDRDGNILARPFQKFFNLGEKQQAGDIDWDEEHLIFEKLDGSMIHPAMINGVPFLMTRKGLTDVARKAHERFMTDKNYRWFMQHCLVDLEITPIFEFTAPDNRIVLPYEDSKLTLIGARETVSGLHLPNWELLSLGGIHDIPVATVANEDSHELMGVPDIDLFVEHIRKLQGAEGVVIRFNDGHMLKLKAEEYLQKHRALDGLNSKKKVVALVLDGYVDDLLPMLDEPDQKELKKFSKDLLFHITETVSKISQVAHTGKLMDRKYFATVFLPSRLASEFYPAAFCALDGGDPRKLLSQFYKRNPDKVPVFWRGE